MRSLETLDQWITDKVFQPVVNLVAPNYTQFDLAYGFNKAAFAVRVVGHIGLSLIANKSALKTHHYDATLFIDLPLDTFWFYVSKFTIRQHENLKGVRINSYIILRFFCLGFAIAWSFQLIQPSFEAIHTFVYHWLDVCFLYFAFCRNGEPMFKPQAAFAGAN